jgi:hypothetical protein
MRASRFIASAIAGACSSFENPEIVLDFRVLAMSAEPPEQLIDVDIQDPAPPVELLEQVVPTEICTLLSDRDFDRRLRWEMTVCSLDNDLRCTGGPTYVIGSGIWDDPEQSPTSPRLCHSIPPDGNLLGVALYAYANDRLRGLGGIYYGVQLRVGGEDADPELDLYAAKNLRLMPRIPAEITANTNPSLERVDVTLADGEPMPLAFGRCRDQPTPLEVPAGIRIRLTPVEPEGVRETYLVPTTDGSSREFTESLTYQWLASAGNYSAGSTGGTRDAFGNPAPLFTDWRAPAAKDLDGPTDVELWFIQRDERLGAHWYESCIRVVP